MTATAQIDEEPGDAGKVEYNQYGQKIGSKGERTRQLIIETTVNPFAASRLRNVSVVDVARAANLSPATFYVYFRNVPEVVLGALESVPQSWPELEALIAQDWLTAGSANALQLVEAYTAFWNLNRTIFSVRNLAAEEGDQQFHRARLKAAAPLLLRLGNQIRLAQLAGLVPARLAPRACAGVLLMMLERLSAVGPMTDDEDRLNYAALKDAAAFSVAQMFGARS